MEKRTPTAIKIVNEALVKSGLEAEFDVKLKSILMLIIDKTLKMGFDNGYEQAKKEVFDDFENILRDNRHSTILKSLSEVYEELKKKHLK